MHSKEELRRQFEKLLNSSDPHGRGKQFERLLGDLLELEGCRVWPRSRAAHPRQTDISIRSDHGDFIVEAKWRQDKIDISDIDNLRKRLQRAGPGFGGCLFSMSDFGKNALDDLIRDKSWLILVFNAIEINYLFNGRTSFDELILRKKDGLSLHSKLWFLKPKVKAELEIFDPTPVEKLLVNDQYVPWIELEADDFDIVFCRSAPQVHGSTLGPFQAIDTKLAIATLSDLEKMFRFASSDLGLVGDGSFTIYQNNMNWCGIGVNNFLNCIANWKQRYRRHGWMRYHHSEELAYCEELPSGLFVLSARQRVGDSFFIHSARLEIVLPGIPVDLKKYSRFLNSVGVSKCFLEPRSGINADLVRSPKRRLRLEVLGFIVEERSVGSNKWLDICSVISKNPFRGMVSDNHAKYDYNSPIEVISQLQALICDLEDHIPYGTVVDEYYLLDIKTANVCEVKLLAPACTWGKIIKSADPRDSFPDVRFKMAETTTNRQNRKRIRVGSLARSMAVAAN